MEALLISLVSIIVGFLINTAWQSYKENKNRKEKTKQILEELKTNFHAIHQKKDHIQKIIKNLENKKILSGMSVYFVDTYYSTYLKNLYPFLSAIERNSLHVIYQYFKLTDQLMSNFENDILKFLSLNVIQDKESIYTLFIDRFKELFQILTKTEELIERYLNGNPIDVFYVNREKKPDRLI